MERLTERYKDSIVNTVLIKECGDKCCNDICEDVDINCAKCAIDKAFKKLADYEDAEEQGLLLKLPCKIGSTVYAICTCENTQKILDDEPEFATGYYCPFELFRKCPHTGDNLCEEVAYKKAIFEDEVGLLFWQGEKMYIELKYTGYCVTVDEIGKTLLFTREEAEKKLEEMQNAENA